jgi:hypothetical protein
VTQPYSYQPQPNYQPPPKRGVPIVVLIVVAVVAAVVGLVLGMVGGLATGSNLTAQPAPTVTAPAPTPATRIVKEEITPVICRKALSDADHLVSVMSDGYQIAAEGFGAVADGDAAGVERATEKLTELKPKLNKALDRYNQSKTECNNH